MKVYHGSTVIVKKPNIEIVDYRTNFENGFYTSLNRDTAEYWAEKKRQEILGKDKTVILKKYINVYEFTENENLSVLDFDKIDKSALYYGKITVGYVKDFYDYAKDIYNYDTTKDAVRAGPSSRCILDVDFMWSDYIQTQFEMKDTFKDKMEELFVNQSDSTEDLDKINDSTTKLT